ncbi:MFS transporter [Streptomyces sp. BE230]|uniref:MFS transporter n=1 Tax=Streptomyces sp. BE230 TaxID=3002526 RepID=UPI002ED4DB51|nr:MFS transporter [Streptomyces sp. BE230]
MSVSADPDLKRPGLVLALLAFAQFISAIDYNIVYVALPDIGRALGFTTQSLQWVVSAYAVALGGLLLLGGRAADLLGPRRMFALALWLYGLASLAGGLATSPGILVAARAVQGIGGALLLPATLSLINTGFAEGPQRNRALAIWGGAGGVGLASGSLLGGVLTNSLGWQAVFYVNVPLALGAALAAARVLPADPARGRERTFDIPGTLTATAAITLLVFGLVNGPETGWASIRGAGALAGGALLLGVFVLIERRTSDPLVPLRLLANRSLLTAMAVIFVFMGTFGTQYYLFTTYLQNVRDYTALATGLAFVPPALIAMAGTKTSAMLLNRYGTRTTMTSGLTLGAIGMATLATGMSPQGSYPALLPGLALLSLGQGIAWTALFASAASGVADHEQGIASALASTTQQIGSAVGLAALVAVANAGLHDDRPPAAQAVVGGLQAAGWTAAAAALAGAVLALTLKQPRPKPAPVPRNPRHQDPAEVPNP